MKVVSRDLGRGKGGFVRLDPRMTFLKSCFSTVGSNNSENLVSTCHSVRYHGLEYKNMIFTFMTNPTFYLVLKLPCVSLNLLLETHVNGLRKKVLASNTA